MAQKVNLREAEYLYIKEELEKMHADQLTHISAFIEEIKTLVTSQDIFCVNKTSVKIADMLDVILNDIVPLLEQAFLDSEAGVSNMVTKTMEIDFVHY
mgnify:CR=1 FL=1